MEVTYSNYLQLEKLLSLQQPLSKGPHHDEMFFILIHQAYELWFKGILYEIDFLEKLFDRNDTPAAVHTLGRICAINKILLLQIDTLKTLAPLEFLGFRNDLGTASGFQSFQFRQLEFTLGYKNHATILRFPEGSDARRHMEERFHKPVLWDKFLHYLVREGYDVPQELLNRDTTQAVQSSRELQAILIDIYRHNPAITQVCERLLDLDEGFQEWRYRHVKMVERMIGSKSGTGGSTGVAYLTSTLFKPAFPDLWAIRTEF